MTSAPLQELTLDVDRRSADAADVVLAGRLDAASAPQLRQTLDSLLDAGAVHLVLDLAATTFVDSAGLAVLVRARRESMAKGGEVVLVRPIAVDAKRVFALTQFDEIFRMVGSRSELRN